MSVEARFYVQSVVKFAASVNAVRAAGWAPPAPHITVKLLPATRGEANKEWASATPSGEITMTIGNPEAAAWFESMLGEDVAITFAARDDS